MDKIRNISAALLALLIAITTLALPALTTPAYADSSSVEYTLTSDEEKLAGAEWTAYKLMSAAYHDDGDLDEGTPAYADGITYDLMSAGYDGIDHTGYIYDHYEGQDGSSDLEWRQLRTLTDAITTAPGVLATKITCDGDPASLPGDGLYLLVMDGYGDITDDDEWIESPSIIIEANDKRTTRNIRFVWHAPDFSVQATHTNHDPYASLTAIYQPENAPQKAQDAQGGQDIAQDDKTPAEATRSPHLPVPLPVIIVAAVIAAYAASQAYKKHKGTIRTQEGASIGCSTEGRTDRGDKHNDEKDEQKGEKTSRTASPASPNEADAPCKPLSDAPDDESEVEEVSVEQIDELFGGVGDE